MVQSVFIRHERLHRQPESVRSRVWGHVAPKCLTGRHISTSLRTGVLDCMPLCSPNYVHTPMHTRYCLYII